MGRRKDGGPNYRCGTCCSLRARARRRHDERRGLVSQPPQTGMASARLGFWASLDSHTQPRRLLWGAGVGQFIRYRNASAYRRLIRRKYNIAHAVEPTLLQSPATGLGIDRGGVPMAFDRGTDGRLGTGVVARKFVASAVSALGGFCGHSQPCHSPNELAVWVRDLEALSDARCNAANPVAMRCRADMTGVPHFGRL